MNRLLANEEESIYGHSEIDLLIGLIKCGDIYACMLPLRYF